MGNTYVFKTTIYLFRAIGFYQCLKFLKTIKRSKWWEMFSNLQIQEDMTIWELFSHQKGTQGIIAKVFLSSIQGESQTMECCYWCLLY